MNVAFENQRDMERKACVLMEQCEVADIIEIPDKMQELSNTVR